VKSLVKVALGIVTSVGGYLEVGSIATAAQAGAAFRFSLLWAILLGTVCIAFLVEMSGRLAAVSKHTVASAVRERFGIRFQALPRCRSSGWRGGRRAAARGGTSSTSAIRTACG
jgi:cytosine/uracil/thiamine/allantoin permease